MTRILYTTLLPNLRAGGQISLMLLLERLDRTKFDPVVLVPAEGEVAQRARDMGCHVKVLPCPPLRSGLSVLSTIYKMRRFLIDKKIDIIHTDAPRQTFYAMFAKVGYHIPLLWHIRTEAKDRLLDLLLERGADRLILVADALRFRFSSTGQLRSTVIHNGVDLTTCLPADVDTVPVIRRPLVFCSSRIDRSKGQELLIRALPSLLNNFPTLTLWFAGDGNEAFCKSLVHLADTLGVREAIHFLGFRRDVRALLSLADLVVLPSYHEAFPRVVLEAMAAGKPIVASRVGGIPEAVEDGVSGLLVPPGEVAPLAEAIETILQDDHRRRAMERAALARIQSFSLQRTVTLTEQLYRECLNGAQP